MNSQIDDKKIQPRDILTQFTGGMWLDSLNSLQPAGTYREAWAVRRESSEENSFGVVNENSNALHVPLPEGYVVRGLAYAEFRDEYIVFLYNPTSKASEIGRILHKKRKYIPVTSTAIEDVGFCQSEWIDMELKVMQPCNRLNVYWSNADTYKVLDIDDPCCDFSEVNLFRCHNLDAVKVSCVGGVGNNGGVPAGVYAVAVRLVDQDGNATNASRISKEVDVGNSDFGDNLPGNRTGQGVNIRLEGLHKDYPIVDIFVISIIDGVTKAALVDSVGHGKGQLNYTYWGDTGKEVVVDIGDILDRKHKYLRGKNVAQHRGHLILYNTISQFEVNVFKTTFRDAEVKAVLYAVPTNVAHKFKGFRPNERYWLGGRVNYCDGTGTRAAPMVGPDGCDTCELDSAGEPGGGVPPGVDLGSLETYTIISHEDPETTGELDDEGNDILDEEDIDTIFEEAEEAAEELDELLKGSGGVDCETLLCNCESLRNILEDITDPEKRPKVYEGDGNVTDGGKDGSVDWCITERGSGVGERFIGANRLEIIQLVCECDKFYSGFADRDDNNIPQDPKCENHFSNLDLDPDDFIDSQIIQAFENAPPVTLFFDLLEKTVC